MNQLAFPQPSLPQEYFTAAELAQVAMDRGLNGFPATERSFRRLAEREGWNDMGPRVARSRPAPKEGGRPAMEYHLSILPPALQQVLVGRAAKSRMVQRVADEGEADRRKLAALKASQVSAAARKVMEARAEVLISIDGYAASRGQSRAWAIARFLAAQDEWRARQEIEARRDVREFLTDREAVSLTQPLLLTSADGFDLSPRRMAAANGRKASPEIGERTLRRWFKSRDEGGVAALAPIPPKDRQPIPPGFADFLKFYALPSKPDIADAHRQYLKHAETPGLHRMPMTLHQVKYILRHRMNNIERAVGREGLLTLRSRLPYVTRSTDDMWPTTVYSADGKTFAAEIGDPVTKRAIRPEITTVIDIVTRKIVGLSLSRSENQRSVAEALRNACCWNGIPAIFYVDRGPGYRNEAMDADTGGLMGRLGITKSHAAPYGSQAKGRIEIVNKTVWDTLAKRLPTYIGADMDKEAGQKVHKLTRRELKEFGESRHLPSWDEFVTLCAEMVEEYNNKPHSSLPKFQDPETGKTRHMSPNECWAAYVADGFEPVPVDPDEADDLFRPYEVRTCRRAQVQWNTNQYFDLALEAYHEEKVMVGYDYHQADKVWVREYDADSGQPGRLICVARFGGNTERYFPKSFEQSAIENRSKGRLRRLDDKRAAVEAERDGMLQIELQHQEPADFIDMAPLEIAEPEPVPVQPARVSRLKESRINPDAELALQCIADPQQLTPGRARLLRDVMATRAGQEVLRNSGVDLTTLDDLLRSAA